MKVTYNGLSLGDLQFFAEEGGQGGAGTAEAPKGQQEPGGAENGTGAAGEGTEGKEQQIPEVSDDLVAKLLEHEAFQKVIQSETDKVRTDYSGRLKQTMAELEELQKKHMSDKEREQYERQKFEKELTEREQRIRMQEIKLTAANELSALGLPANFIDYVTGEDADSTKQKIAQFSEVWRDELDKAVKEHFKQHGVTPGQASGGRPTVNSNMNDLIRQAAGRS